LAAERQTEGEKRSSAPTFLYGIYRFLDDEKRFAAHLFCKKYKDDAELL